MNNKGFSYVEMVCAIIIIVVLVSISLYFIHPKFLFAKESTFLTQANNITKAAINKYTNDGQEDIDVYPDDIYPHYKENDEYVGRVCYSLKSLKGKYIEKIDDSFQGSVEICTASSCKYKTKLWLSNDKYFVDGAEDNVTKKQLAKHVLGINHCGNIIE